MRTVLGCAVLVLVLGYGAFGDVIADGNLSEWGVTPGTNWNNNIGASQWVEPEIGSNGYVGPGYGGQKFNVEAVYTFADCQYLYYAIVTGLPESGARGPDDAYYYPGDVLIDFDPTYVPSSSQTPTGRMDFAVETTTYAHDYWHGGKAGENQGAGSLYSEVGLELATGKWDGVYYPVEIDRDGSDRLADGTLVGQTDFAYTDDYYGPNHWVIEGRIPLALFGQVGDAYGLSWTMTCANDIGKVIGEIPLCETPEPGSVMLLGTGCLAGVGCWLRRRMK